LRKLAYPKLANSAIDIISSQENSISIAEASGFLELTADFVQVQVFPAFEAGHNQPSISVIIISGWRARFKQNALGQ